MTPIEIRTLPARLALNHLSSLDEIQDTCVYAKIQIREIPRNDGDARAAALENSGRHCLADIATTLLRRAE
jgi:hypothetical protein